MIVFGESSVTPIFQSAVRQSAREVHTESVRQGTLLWTTNSTDPTQLNLKSQPQPQQIDEFILMGVSSNDTILHDGDVVSVWNGHRGGQCLSLTAAKTSVNLAWMVQEVLGVGGSQQSNLPIGLHFEDKDKGERCWFRVALVEGNISEQTFVGPQPWQCSKCPGENLSVYRKCKLCENRRPITRTNRPIKFGDQITFMPIALKDHHLSSCRNREVRCSPRFDTSCVFEIIDSTRVPIVSTPNDAPTNEGEFSGVEVRSTIISSMANVLTSAIEREQTPDPINTFFHGLLTQTISGVAAIANRANVTLSGNEQPPPTSTSTDGQNARSGFDDASMDCATSPKSNLATTPPNHSESECDSDPSKETKSNNFNSSIDHSGDNDDDFALD